MYKDILCLITQGEHNIIRIFKKHRYKIDTVFPTVSLEELENLIYEKNYDIFLVSGFVDKQKRAKI
ncbi:MAG: hypothetical protein SNJ64_02640, partial [Endomicrobiia bacterium]